MGWGKRSKARKANLGSVSSGTMRPEDLIPAFLDAAEALRLSKADRTTIRKARREWERCKEGEGDAKRNGACRFHETNEDCGEQLDFLLNEDLFNLLERYAPPFAYFGANEGDGADYGFWPSMEALEDAVREGEVFKTSTNGFRVWVECGTERRDATDEAYSPTPTTARYRMVVSDHGNVTLYYRNGREVWGVV